MNTTSKRVILAGILAAVVAASVSAENVSYGAAAAKAAVNPTVEQMLVFAIQDEYLARAEYELIMSREGKVRPFSNIIEAEEQHIKWLADLMLAKGYKVPADQGAAHAALPKDLKAAYEAGVKAEVDNIAMYDAFLKRDLPADVRALFERLRAASENHLQAFRANLARAQ